MRYWSIVLTLCLSVLVSNPGIAQTNYCPESPVTRQSGSVQDFSSFHTSHLLKKSLPLILNPDSDTVLELKELEVKWLYSAALNTYAVSLEDLNTGEFVFSDLTVYEPYLRIETEYLKYGHHYRLRVATTDASGLEFWSYSSFKINVLPALSGLALDMALNERIVWENCQPALITARDQLVRKIKQEGWTIYFTSAYRPYQLQEHYYLILQNLKDHTLDKDDIEYLQQEKRRHGLGSLASKPTPDAPHIRGAAFDAIVLDSRGRALNGLRFMHPRLLTLMEQLGFKAPPARDYVHFEIDK